MELAGHDARLVLFLIVTSIPIMMKATKKDESDVVRILSSAFLDNKSVNYIVGQDDRRLDRVQALMRYSFRTCLEFGEVWLSDDRECCALVVFPDAKRMRVSAALRDIQLVFEVIGFARMFSVMRREARLKKLYSPNLPVYYIWFIGVSPDMQGRGSGTLMMADLLSRASDLGRVVYLETSTVRNLAWYTSLGFEQYKVLDFGYPLYCFRKTV